MNQKAFTPIAIILIIAGVLIIGGGVWWWKTANRFNLTSIHNCPNDRETITCPDGTIVKCVSGFFLVQKTTAKPPDWQTYRNEEYGFEFKYPNEYNKYQQCKPRLSYGPPYDVPSGKGQRAAILNLGDIIFATEPKINDDISKTVDLLLKVEVEQNSGKLIGRKNFLVDGHQAIKIDFTDSEKVRQIQIYIRKDNWDYVLRALNADDFCVPETANLRSEAVLDGVLSTFKFIK